MSEKNPWNKTNQWEEELNLVISMIAKTELVEMTKWGGSVYTIDNKNVVGLGGFKSYLAIWFFNGVFLKDEAQVLVNAQEGVTKALRQWRFQSKEGIIKNEKLILQYLQEAITNEKAGISKKPEKKEAIISDLLNLELKNNTALASAFETFSPYKQREFLEYVESAKQEKTKLTRIEKIKPMILQGIGLNDKYR
ncbi:YdeI/OmpD-associated family protein [Flavobacterium sp.]|uniref:YdeI/OmpD-associated family protein n=1 Tax=Flavobacterium sp. TaxID=239 RepID=UPI003D6BDF31